MVRVLAMLVALALLCAACGNVGAPAPTPPPPDPLQFTAELIGEIDMMITLTNSASEPLDLGGWMLRVTPVLSPTLVAPLPFPEQFVVRQGEPVRFHTAGGTNSATSLYFDNGGIVPPAAWESGVKIELHDPQSEQKITRYIYSYSYNPQ